MQSKSGLSKERLNKRPRQWHALREDELYPTVIEDLLKTVRWSKPARKIYPE